LISAEFIVNTGSYQHVKLTVAGEDLHAFLGELNSIHDRFKAQLGEFQAELESWVRGVYDKLAEKDLEGAQKLLQDALGSTVIESKPNPAAPPQDSSQPAWNRKPETTKPAPWKAQASTDSGDDW